MKLTGRAATGYFAHPDRGHAGCLIHGADPMRVDLRRREIVAALLAGDEMGLTRLSAAEVRRDSALLIDAVKERSMFAAGDRVVLMEEAGDGTAAAVKAALEDHAPGDAYLVVTGLSLNARSKLRKAVEDHAGAVSIGVYDDPPDRGEIEAMLKDAGLADLPRDAWDALQTLSRGLDPSDFRQTVVKLGLYKQGDASPVTPAEIEAMAPLTREAEVDDLLHLVAEARASEVPPMLRRLAGQGVQPVALSIAAARHFRTLHAAAADPKGPAAGLARARPPVFGPRRDRMARQAQAWGVRRLEEALRILTDTDLQLRSSSAAPQGALTERALIRLAMLLR